MRMNSRVLFLTLNWGLGHISRTIPVVREALEQGCEVFFAGSDLHQDLLRKRFPTIRMLNIPVPEIRLSRMNSQAMAILRQLPGFYRQYKRDQIHVERLVAEHRIDLIISDNVYGGFSRHCTSVILTHQLQIILPGFLRLFRKPVMKKLRKMLACFDEIWIPDDKQHANISGVLSDHISSPVRIVNIGILSRFQGMESAPASVRKGSILAILSGPEPQRSILEEKLRKQASMLGPGYRFSMLRGLPGIVSETKGGEITHLEDAEFAREVARAECILCRSGYSTIMDLLTLGRTAVLVPTPGQTEQEYLAERLSEKGLFCSMEQSGFSLEKAIRIMQEQQPNRVPPSLVSGHEMLSRAMAEVLKRSVSESKRKAEQK